MSCFPYFEPLKNAYRQVRYFLMSPLARTGGEFPIVGEWTRDRREFLKCEIRIHVPAGSIAQGEYDIT